MLHWPDATVYGALAGLADERPDAPAVVFEGRRLTRADLLDGARATARALAAHGVGEGDTVAVWLGNRPEWLTAQLGASMVGAAVVAVNTRYRAHELEYMLADSGCSLLLTESEFLGRDYLDLLAEAVPGLDGADPFPTGAFPDLDGVVTVEERPDYPGVTSHGTFLDAGEGETVDPATDPLAPAAVFYTSGTTGDPKGCLQSNRSLLNHSYAVGEHFGLDGSDVALGMMPFPGIMGYNAFLSALVHGVPLVVLPHFDAERAVDAIDDYGVTYASGTDAMFARMLDADGFDPSRVDSFERGAVFFAGGFDEATFERIEDGFGFPVVQPYGLSEANSQVFVGDPGDPVARRKRVGGPLVHPDEEEARVVDPETGEAVAPGEQGELLLRGYNTMLGYHEKPDATAEAFDEDDWLHTGDLAERDEAGSLYYHARLDDALRVRGFLLTPRDVERAVEAFDGVERAQVVGVPHERHGEVPVAFVVPADATDEATLVSFLEGRLADYKRPDAVHFLDAFPTTEGPNGVKVRKSELREMALERRS
ncbi:MAG: AMP-binding protein [Haloarculaceae archaeon]